MTDKLISTTTVKTYRSGKVTVETVPHVEPIDLEELRESVGGLADSYSKRIEESVRDKPTGNNDGLFGLGDRKK